MTAALFSACGTLSRFAEPQLWTVLILASQSASRVFKIVIVRVFLCANDSTFPQQMLSWARAVQETSPLLAPPGTGGRPGWATGGQPVSWPAVCGTVSHVVRSQVSPMTTSSMRCAASEALYPIHEGNGRSIDNMVAALTRSTASQPQVSTV